MKKVLLCLLLLNVVLINNSFAQYVGVNTQNPQATLDVFGDSSGILIPRIPLLNTNDVATIVSPNVSELIYNTATNGSGATAVVPGFYYWNGSKWVLLLSSNVNSDHDFYEVGTTTAPDNINDTIFHLGDVGIGINKPTSKLHINGDAIPLKVEKEDTLVMQLNNRTLEFLNSNFSTYIGEGVGLNLNDLTSGGNTIVGHKALENTTDAGYVVAVGREILKNTTNASYVTAIGDGVIKNTSGPINYVIAIGQSSMSNATGSFSIGIGQSSLAFNEGSNNIGIGRNSLYSNSTGERNIALGNLSLSRNTTGVNNIGIGNGAISNNTTSSNNIGIGISSLALNSTGERNIALGNLGLLYNSTGAKNIAIGDKALMNNSHGSRNIGIGNEANGYNSTGSDNIGIGDRANYLTRRGNNIAIGNLAGMFQEFGERNIFIGNSAGKLNGNYSSSGSIKIGHEAGMLDTTSHTLYIENSSSNNPLIYGEFDNDILRTNGTFQINNPSVTGYQFPTTDGSNGQILSTDGNGTLSWSTAITPSNDHDFYEVGTTTAPDNINDTIFHLGDVGIGINNPTSKLHINGDTIPLKVEKEDTLVMQLNNRTLEFLNTSYSVFVGENAGINMELLHANNYHNTFVGYSSGMSAISGTSNTALGSNTLRFSTTASSNTAIGRSVLQNTTTGSSNNGLGYLALHYNTTGNNNVAIGSSAMYSNTIGAYNTSVGNFSLNNNTTGVGNTAIGFAALRDNTTGYDNVAVGGNALYNNESGNSNTAIGKNSLNNNTTGSHNIAFGKLALFGNETGNNNIGIGFQSSFNNLSGEDNIAIGRNTGFDQNDGDRNIYIGAEAGYHFIGVNNYSATGNIKIGYQAGSSDTSDYRLYIENSSSNNPLIYGEFDNDILRTNGTFQINNPSVNGYQFPITDGSNGQILATDGNGTLTWQTLSGADADWYEAGNTPPNSINDNIYTGGNVGIGDTSPTTPLSIEANGASNPVGITQNEVGNSSSLEFTTKGSGTAQVSRIVIDGNSNNADVEFYRGSAGAETKTMHIEGSNGDIFGGFRHITYHSFSQGAWSGNPGNDVIYFPTAGGEGADDEYVAGYNGQNNDYRRTWVAPYDGKLVKVIIRVGNNSGSNPELRGYIAMSLNGVYRRVTTSISGANNDNYFSVYPSTQNTFSEGDRIAVGFDTNCSNCYMEDTDYFVTLVWKYEIWD